MANVEVGSAYVSVYPKADKNFNNKVGQDIGTTVGTGAMAKSVAIGNIVSSAILSGVQAAADGIGAIIGGALSNYADYEQLVGGVDTLFAESSEIVQKHAQEAFKTAGLSANEYMETVTGFSASLLQGLGGDTEEAARYADMAIQDMSDNANKMGTDMALIQNAYQGFAKQNYTMLDNLKLGYGGTKSEMERLLKDASELAGVEFDIDNYDDVIEAIHVMQESMGVAGTTAKEAQGTISGSINMTKAAWANLLTELGKDDADISARIDELLESGMAVIENIAPRLVTVIGSIIDAIPQIIDKVSPYIDKLAMKVGEFIEQHQPEIEAAGKVFFDGLTNALTIAIDASIKALGAGLVELVKHIPQYEVMMLDATVQLMMSIVEGIVNGINPTMNALEQLFNEALDSVGSFFAEIGNNIATAVSGIVDGVVSTASGMVDAVVNVLTPIIDSIASIFAGVQSAIQDPIAAARDFVSGIVGEIVGFFSGLGDRITAAIGSIHFPQPSVEWESLDIGGVAKIPIPHVTWAARGGIVDGATLIGAGERGPEAIVPLSGDYMRPFAQAIAAEMGGGGTVINLNLSYDASDDASALARGVARKLGAIMDMRG